MWDRRIYRTTDFGLEDGETFEPPDASDPEDVDETLPHIMTVLGPVVPEQLGICLPHEHILSDPAAGTGVGQGYRLDRIDLACEELGTFFSVGGRSIVDASTIDYGRDLAGLRAIAQQVPVHIVAVTGRNKHLHASRMGNPLDQAAIEQELHTDIDAAIKPGMISFGTSLDEITDVERTAARACSSVAARTGYPVTTHLEAGTMAHEQLDLVEAAGLDPARVILGHLDRKLDFDFLKGVANRGASISFDQVGKVRYGADAGRAEMLVRLADAGFENQLLISQDLDQTSDFLAHGGFPGWIHLLERFTLDLMQAGATAHLVRKLLIDNPAGALSIRP